MSVRELITEHLGLWAGTVTQKSTRGRGRNGKVELTGIKKLRELILELAIHGKLVSQNPDEEAATTLFAQIVEEKAQLIEKGAIKKPKKLPEIEASEVPFRIPGSWKFIRLGDAVEIIRGITFPASEKSKSPAPGRVACLRTTNVQDKIEFEDILYIRDSFVSRNSQYIKSHDIVMSMANSRELVGKVAIIEADREKPTTFGGFLGVLRPIQIHPRYLMAVLRANSTRNTLIDSASQTTNIANISIGKLNPLVIGLPPQEEQHRIVQKVDELLALCDRLEQQTSDQLEAHETLVKALLGTLTQSENATELSDNWARLAAHFDILFATEQSIDKLKQTILQLAVMGRLVEQDVEDETVEALIARLQDEKHQLVKQGDIRKPKKVPPTLLESHPFPIPLTWRWARLSFLVSILGDGLHGTPKYSTNGDFYFINGTNLRRGKISTFPETKRVTSEEYSKYKKDLNSRTMLVSINGTLGNIALYNGERVVLGKSACYFNLLECLSKSYIRVVLESPYFVSYAKNLATGSTIKNLSLRAMNELLIPLPPPNEQNRIVQKVDELMALCDQLKERLNQTSETRCQLAGAVVEKALN
jgi:type I restriction enzyme S subunit